MENVGFVMHDQKFPERHVLHLLLVLLLMLPIALQPKRFVKLGVRVDVQQQKE